MRRFIVALVALLLAAPVAIAQTPPPSGHDLGRPGLTHHLSSQDLPAPYATRSASNPPRVAARPSGAVPLAPPGFTVSEFLTGLHNPRELRAAPNGDIFVAESAPGRIRVVRAPKGTEHVNDAAVFAEGLERPFGIAFYPPGPDPQYVYIGNENSVVRFPYRNGDLTARGKSETIVKDLPSGGGHWTRNLAFASDGKTLYVTIGSGSNDEEQGEAHEKNRADILAFDPDGTHMRVYAAGLRNAVGIAYDPASKSLIASVNERDGLGDELPPDYVTRVKEGAFYGWPWFYIGDHPDPRHKDTPHAELDGKVVLPDVLIQPHSAPLGLTIYDGGQFPAAYRGDVFVALHGSWNRDKRTGYKLIRVRMANGVPTGVYEDFVTGFLMADGNVWGRPVGVAVAPDGALIMSDDGSGTLWRIAYIGAR